MTENNRIDLSLFSITNSIISKNDSIDNIIDDLLFLLLKKYNAEYCGIYFKFGQNDIIHRYVKKSLDKSINMKNEPVPTIIQECFQEKKIREFNNGYLFPLFFGDVMVGVLSIFFETPEKKFVFDGIEKDLFISFLNHLSSLILNLKNRHVLKDITQDNTERKISDFILKGIGVSGDISFGYALLEKSLKKNIVFDIGKKNNIDKDFEYKKVTDAINNTLEVLKEAEEIIRERGGDDLANIFVFHQALLTDPEFTEKLSNYIYKENLTAEMAVLRVFNEIKSNYDKSMSHIISDIHDLEQQILHFLVHGEKRNVIFTPTRDYVYVADLLLPSEVIKHNNDKIKGFIEGKGGVTGHAAILARSLNIPMISGVGQEIKKIKENDYLILDPYSGFIFINPTEEAIKEYIKLKEEKAKTSKELIEHLKEKKETYTKDGTKIEVGANIGILSEIAFAKKYYAEYIGLYRTEFPFMIRYTYPTEDEQYTIYKQLVENFGQPEKPIIIRTLDIGGDKIPSYITMEKEPNPALGFRSIRIMLEYRDQFKAQIRAILRASIHGYVKLMFPLISSIEEVKELLKLVEECKAELRVVSIPFNENIEIGAMIEVPSAVLIIDKILNYFSFVSIGTNDLVQYTLAVDRENSKVGKWFKPLHPAILRSIKLVVDQAKVMGKEVSICGEMAANPLYFVVLAGLGIRKFSINVHSLPIIKNFVSKIDLPKTEELAKKALELETAKEIETLFLEELSHVINYSQ